MLSGVEYLLSMLSDHSVFGWMGESGLLEQRYCQAELLAVTLISSGGGKSQAWPLSSAQPSLLLVVLGLPTGVRRTPSISGKQCTDLCCLLLLGWKRPDLVLLLLAKGM